MLRFCNLLVLCFVSLAVAGGGFKIKVNEDSLKDTPEVGLSAWEHMGTVRINWIYRDSLPHYKVQVKQKCGKEYKNLHEGLIELSLNPEKSFDYLAPKYATPFHTFWKDSLVAGLQQKSVTEDSLRLWYKDPEKKFFFFMALGSNSKLAVASGMGYLLDTDQKTCTYGLFHENGKILAEAKSFQPVDNILSVSVDKEPKQAFGRTELTLRWKHDPGETPRSLIKFNGYAVYSNGNKDTLFTNLQCATKPDSCFSWQDVDQFSALNPSFIVEAVVHEISDILDSKQSKPIWIPLSEKRWEEFKPSWTFLVQDGKTIEWKLDHKFGEYPIDSMQIDMKPRSYGKETIPMDTLVSLFVQKKLSTNGKIQTTPWMRGEEESYNFTQGMNWEVQAMVFSGSSSWFHKEEIKLDSFRKSESE